MDRIPMMEPENGGGEVARLYEHATALINRIPNSWKVMAHQPFIAKFILPLTSSLLWQGLGSILSTRTKQLAIIKTSAMNNCAYWLAHNRPVGQSAGFTEKQIEDISSDGYMDSAQFSEKDKAAIQWAECVTNKTAGQRDDVFEEVRKHFSESELVELTMVATYFDMRNKFNDAMRISIEEQDQINLTLKRRKDPASLKQYLEAILADWPAEFPDGGD